MRKSLVLLMLGMLAIACVACQKEEMQEVQTSVAVAEQKSETQAETEKKSEAEEESDTQESTSEEHSGTGEDEEKDEANPKALELFRKLIQESRGDELTQEENDLFVAGAVQIENSAFLGEWNRTEVRMGNEGNLIITENADQSVIASGDFFAYGNSGYIWEAPCLFLNDVSLVILDEEGSATYLLQLNADGMQVSQYGFGCMGAGAFGYGKFVKGAPVYTDAFEIQETFTAEELAAVEALMQVNGLDYEEYFINAISGSYGPIITPMPADLENGSHVDGRLIEAYAPHGLTRNLVMYIDNNGDIYMTSSYNFSDAPEYYTTNLSQTYMPAGE